MENSEQPISTHGVGEKEEGVEISFTKDEAHISFPHLDLSAENPTSQEVQVEVEKKPIKLEEGKSYCNGNLLIDKETENMHELAQEAEDLKSLPETERVTKVLDILMKNMHYAHNNVVEKLALEEPEKAQWVAKNTGLNLPVSPRVALSDLIENGHGVCRHLAPAYLWLAQKAGLKGVLLSSDHHSIKNIERSDTKQKLFQSTEVGEAVAAHVWVEIQTSDGRWIPVDPSTKLVGGTESGLAMFNEANYEGTVLTGLNFEVGPSGQVSLKFSPLLFAPGEARTSGMLSLELSSTKSKLKRISSEKSERMPPTNIPYSGPGELSIKTGDQQGYLDLDITSIKELVG